MSELAALGDEGVAELVKLIGSQRAAVSRQARATIAAEVDRWLGMPSTEATPRITALVHALAQQLEQYGPSGREFSEDLIDMLMAARIDGQPAVADAALPDCQRMLELLAADHRMKWGRRENPLDAEANLPALANADLPDDSADHGLLHADSPPLASVPQELTLPDQTAEANAAEPMRIPTVEEEESPIEPDRLDLEPDPMRALPEMPTAKSHTPVRPTRLEQPIEMQSAETASYAHDRQSEDEQIMEWMRELHHVEPRIAERAEAHLAAAGFNPPQIELARELTSPDPKVRERLAEVLPRVPNIDAKTWLIWLSRDQHADVRIAAISTMATINDPEFLQRIRELTRHDPDHRVQQAGERLLGRRHALP